MPHSHLHRWKTGARRNSTALARQFYANSTAHCYLNHRNTTLNCESWFRLNCLRTGWENTLSRRERCMPLLITLCKLAHLHAYKRTINAYKRATCWKFSTGLNNVVLHPVNKVVNKFVNEVVHPL